MKKASLTLLALVAFVMSAVSQPSIQQLPEAVCNTLQNCIVMMDNGMAEAAMDGLNALADEYPNNYVVQYERMYALYMLGKYDEVARTAKKLLKHEEATALVYHIYGNALDNIGKPNKARKAYLDGLKRFPDAGMLCLELGIIDVRENKYDEAIKRFEEGILASPAFASNYFRAAQLYFASENHKIWALVYGEAEALLAPGQAHRQAEMAAGIRDTWMSALTFENRSDSVSAKVSFVPSRQVMLDTTGGTSYLGFDGVFEGCAVVAAQKLVGQIHPFIGSIEQLTALRGGILETYFELTDNLYGNSMYLFPFQKSVMEAGHWEAYNYYLFRNVCPEEFEAWGKNQDNSDKLSAFIQWYKSSPFNLDAERSVSRLTVFRDFRKLNFMEALTIQAALLTDKKDFGK